jgi:hypothetical protein
MLFNTVFGLRQTDDVVIHERVLENHARVIAPGAAELRRLGLEREGC